MRTCFVVVAAAALAAGAPEPQKIVFARVFPNAGQIGLFIAAADGSGEHPLLATNDIDYDPVWSPDAASIVFTSDRDGSADLYRAKPDGTGVERLTDSPAYDDQAAFSPDGAKLVFVSTRGSGTANLWTLELQAKRVKPLTSGAGGDFRPSWSPDGAWIAFASGRGSGMPFAHGRWEHLQLADLYVIHPDGSGLKRITAHGNFCGSPKWTADSRRVIAYCMDAEQTLETRRPSPLPGNDTRLVSIDIATGARIDIPSGAGIKFNPSFVTPTEIGYIRKDTNADGIYYTSGARGPMGPIRAAAWSPDGRRVVFHRRLTAPPTTWKKVWSRNAGYEMTLTGILPSFSPEGDRFVFTGRPPAGTAVGSSVAVAATGTDKYDVIYQDKTRNVLAPQWSPRGDRIIFSVGIFDAFFNGFNTLPNIGVLTTFNGEPAELAGKPGSAGSAGSASIVVNRTYPAIRTYGGDVAVPTKWFTIKSEAAYFTSSTPLTDEYVLYVLQIERQTGEWVIVAGYAGEAITAHRSALSFAPDRGMTRSIVARASYTIDPVRSLAFETAVRQNGDGLYGKIEYSQTSGRHWRATVTGVGIGGHSDDFLGQYHRNSHAAVALRYSF